VPSAFDTTSDQGLVNPGAVPAKHPDFGRDLCHERARKGQPPLSGLSVPGAGAACGLVNASLSDNSEFGALVLAYRA
jgi:hypothetical protein